MLRNGSSLRSYNDFARRNGSGHSGDATMLRDNPEGSSSRWLSRAGGPSSALHVDGRKSSDDRPSCLENPRPAGAESTLTENASSPFHAEPKHHPKPGCGGSAGCLEKFAAPVLSGMAMRFTPGESSSELEAHSAQLLRVVGDFTAGVPPVPIPNTEVKPRRADGTARAKCVGA